MFSFLEQGCERTLAGTPLIPRLCFTFEVARQASSPSLCTSVRAVPWAHEAEQELARLAPSGCQLSADSHIFGGGLRKKSSRHPPLIPRLRLTFEVARQASSPSLCASVRAVAWADEAEQQLPRLAPSGCRLSADVLIFRAELSLPPCTDAQKCV